MTIVIKTTDLNYGIIEGVLANPIPAGIFPVEIGTGIGTFLQFQILLLLLLLRSIWRDSGLSFHL